MVLFFPLFSSTLLFSSQITSTLALQSILFRFHFDNNLVSFYPPSLSLYPNLTFNLIMTAKYLTHILTASS